MDVQHAELDKLLFWDHRITLNTYAGAPSFEELVLKTLKDCFLSYSKYWVPEFINLLIDVNQSIKVYKAPGEYGFMRERYNIWTSKEIPPFLKTIWSNDYLSKVRGKNTQTDLSISLGKSGGVIGNRLAALQNAGLLKSERQGQKVFYILNLPGYFLALNEKHLKGKHRLILKNAEELAEKLYDIQEEFLFTDPENENTIEDALKNTASILKSNADFAKMKSSGGIIFISAGEKVPKLANRIEELSDETLEKLTHLKVPNIINKLLSLLQKATKEKISKR